MAVTSKVRCFVAAVTLAGGTTLGGCTLDITDVADAPEGSAPVMAAPAVLVVHSDLTSASPGDRSGHLRTVVELHAGTSGDGVPRAVSAPALRLHGVDVKPEIVHVNGDVSFVRWTREDSVEVRRLTLSITPPAVEGLVTPPHIETQVGIDLEPTGDIVLQGSTDLVLEIGQADTPPGYLPSLYRQWQLRVGELTLQAFGATPPSLMIPAALLDGVTLPATLDLAVSTGFRRDFHGNDGYGVDVRSTSRVWREVSRHP